MYYNVKMIFVKCFLFFWTTPLHLCSVDDILKENTAYLNMSSAVCDSIIGLSLLSKPSSAQHNLWVLHKTDFTPPYFPAQTGTLPHI